MDPSTDPPATTEPAAHIAHAANPTPSHGPNSNHPPYAEMITAAIVALKDKKGSSRRAIAKYIEKEYSNLPPSHSALLTHHLKRLKNSGQLSMVKHSYKLPRSVRSGNIDSASSGPKRGPGRPPKPKAIAPANVVMGPESVLASLGLVDGPVKRPPGRPPKPKILSVVVDPGAGPLVKKRPGRPPRPKSLALVMGQGRPKKGRGRPPRIGPMNVTRPRGRPKKDGSIVKPSGRPRGRPPRNVAAGGELVLVGGVLPAKQRGRPPKLVRAKKPRKLTGKPLGRPKKSASILAIHASEPQLLIAHQDLKSKLEHFQSRIKQAVSVLKPCLNNETSVSALGALQELEELATMDISVPSNIQAQEPLFENREQLQ